MCICLSSIISITPAICCLNEHQIYTVDIIHIKVIRPGIGNHKNRCKWDAQPKYVAGRSSFWTILRLISKSRRGKIIVKMNAMMRPNSIMYM